MAAADYFLKIDGIDGESTDKDHKGEIELQSFSWSGSLNSVAGHSAIGGAGMGKVQAGSLDCKGILAKDTPKLFAALCSGTSIGKAVLTARKSGTDGKYQDYVKLTMSDCAISSLNLDSGAGSIPTTSFGLSFAKLEWEYKAMDAKGNLSVASTSGWHFKQNVKV